LLVKRQDGPYLSYLSYLLDGKRVHRLLGQDAVALAQSFLQLAESFMPLLLDCAEGPVDPGFKISGSTFFEMLIEINAEILTIHENIPLDVRTLIQPVRRRLP
jgi:hypothetical protein